MLVTDVELIILILCQLKGYFELLRQRKTPTSYIYSEKDKLVDTSIFHEMTRILGADLCNVTSYNKEGKIIQGSFNFFKLVSSRKLIAFCYELICWF